ncbi:hypothetical protein L211DRAFT_840749 [Terfezia boudieri ATCC MYA-4762]|uniref:Uncharacterized protein n=1 Tax=Terfezia boudieri ATCC MYA-4762 TaxID=1051890 RepID=A0A3N4LIQ8_9PEZI|nr:hypothetical protein L211DRAFT_840749 [Terfezia boudieri ATCC MYA-4762]
MPCGLPWKPLPGRPFGCCVLWVPLISPKKDSYDALRSAFSFPPIPICIQAILTTFLPMDWTKPDFIAASMPDLGGAPCSYWRLSVPQSERIIIRS